MKQATRGRLSTISFIRRWVSSWLDTIKSRHQSSVTCGVIDEGTVESSGLLLQRDIMLSTEL